MKESSLLSCSTLKSRSFKRARRKARIETFRREKETGPRQLFRFYETRRWKEDNAKRRETIHRSQERSLGVIARYVQ